MNKKKYYKYILPVSVFAFTAIILSAVQINLERPILIAERFIKGAGWAEVLAVSFYASFVAWKMQDPVNVPVWRRITWNLFSIVFFSQLIIGIAGIDKFLMTGKLHLPIPAMILAGPVYRGHLSVMTILFLSTVILTGPAWCSHLCYFGAFDSLSSRGKTSRKGIRNKAAIKSTILLIVIAVTLLLLWLKVPVLTATLSAVAFAIGGILVMALISRKKGMMVHCTVYCPIGTAVSVLKYVNPFRMYIDNSCNACMRCTPSCKYDALSLKDIRNKKPGITCTYCGDCLASCKDNSIGYRLPGFSPGTSRMVYLFLTISLHASFLAMARI